VSIRISISDVLPIYRAGLDHVLSREPDFLVVGHGGPDNAVALAEKDGTEVLILGSDTAADGLTMASEIRRRFPRVRIVFLTASERQEDVSAALQIGVAAYILRTIAASDLLQTLRMIMRGETYITPSLATRLLLASQRGKASGDPIDRQLQSLTDREREVLRELTLGRTNKEIARNLDLTEKTIKYHMGRVMQKLSARNRTEAALRVREVAF
jgi:two-component system, NarL family, nitrate/nitrite response regulator NarL